jgi:hypothetical protein
MSEKINPNSYLLPVELMEPQRPVTPEGYSIVKREKIENAQLRSIPESLNPIFLQSTASEKAVKGGEGGEFRELQDAAYAEREKNRNEWIERELGEVALEATVDVPVSGEVSNTSSLERESSQKIELNFKLVADEVSTLKYANENFRELPEAERRHNLNVYITKKANAAHDEFKAGKISEESYSVMTNALLGAANSHDSIGAVVDMLRHARTLDADEMDDLLSQAGAISEIASLSGLEGERARISFANSLIAKSERLLDDNDNVATSRYRSMVGFIAGLSTQIKDPSASNGFVSGALERLKKYS